jgi:cold shock CspA family protein
MEKDLFFHAKELVGTEFEALAVGDRVSFEVGEDDRGQHAARVTKI